MNLLVLSTSQNNWISYFALPYSIFDSYVGDSATALKGTLILLVLIQWNYNRNYLLSV
jgi:hypothetical protein